MLVRPLSCLSLVLIATIGRAQFVQEDRDEAGLIARKAEIQRHGTLRLAGDSRLLRMAAKVPTRQPLNAARATILARAYFSIVYGACGSAGHPHDGGAFWRFSPHYGYGAAQGEEIVIDKATGRTSSKGLPTIVHPRDFSRYVLPNPRFKG